VVCHPAEALSRRRSGERRDMLNKEQKAKVVTDLKVKFEKTKGMVMTDYKGLTVAEISELRDLLRASGIEYKVVKNTLARIASDGTPMEAAKDQFKGPVGVAMGFDDAAVVAKTVLVFSKKNKKLKVLGGVVDGNLYDASALQTIASLPSREVLLGMLAGTMNAPASKLASLMNATVVRFAYALGALRDKKSAA